MATNEIVKKSKKQYTKPQLLTYGSIVALTKGDGSQVDGFMALGSDPGTIPTPFPTPTPHPGGGG
jgi:hypothetical protein